VEETDHVSDPRICEPNELSGLVFIGDFPSVIEDWHSHCASTFPGECVLLRRELGNPDDPNAIAILNTRGRKLGYLLREQSADLAPLMDHWPVILTGRLLSPGEAGYRKELAQTRPQLIVSEFIQLPPGYTIPAKTTVKSGYPQTMLDRPT
jgi:HIRAN domain